VVILNFCRFILNRVLKPSPYERIFVNGLISTAAIFLIGVLSKRVNSQGAIAALITGFVFGIARLILELNKESLGGFLFNYTDLNFQYIDFL
jgi:Na+/proline symporter